MELLIRCVAKIMFFARFGSIFLLSEKKKKTLKNV